MYSNTLLLLWQHRNKIYVCYVGAANLFWFVNTFFYIYNFTNWSRITYKVNHLLLRPSHEAAPSPGTKL